jgi:hypothetical protein
MNDRVAVILVFAAGTLASALWGLIVWSAL